MPVRASRAGSPVSSTRPGTAAARAAGPERPSAGGPDRRERARRDHEPLIPGGRLGGIPAGAEAQRPAGVEVGRRRVGAHPQRDAAERAREVAAAPAHATVARHVRDGHARARDLADPDGAPLALGARGALGERRAQDLQPERTAAQRARGASTRPSAPTSTGGLCSPPALRRTSVGRRTVSSAASRRSSRTVEVRCARHSSHAVRPSSHEPIHARGEPSNALEARKPGRPSKRPDDSKPFGPPTSSSIGAVLGARVDGPPAVGLPRPRGRRRDPALDPALAVLAVAHQLGARRPAARVAPERVVARRALEQVRQAGRVAGPGPRARARRARAGAAPRAPARRGCAARGSLPAPSGTPSGVTTRAIRTRSERTPFRPSSSRFQPGSDAEGAARHLDRRHLRAPVGVRQQLDRVDVGRPLEAHLDPVARLLERAVGLPVRRGVAVEGGERPPLGELRVGGRERHPQVARAVVRRHGLPVAAARREQVEHRGVGRERVVGGQRPAVVLRHPRGGEHAPAVGVGDHDLARAAHLRGILVAGVGDPPGRQRPKAARPASASAAAVDDRGALRRPRSAHHRPRAGRDPRRARAAARAPPPASPPRAARAHRAPGGVGLAELVEHVGGVGGRRRAAPGAVVVRPRPRPSAPTAGRAAARPGRAPRAAAARARRPSTGGRRRAGRRTAPRSGRPPAASRARAGSRRRSRPSRSPRRAGRGARPRGRRRRPSRRRGRPRPATPPGRGPRSAASRAPGRARAASTRSPRAPRGRPPPGPAAPGRERAARAPRGAARPPRPASASASSGPAL